MLQARASRERRVRRALNLEFSSLVDAYCVRYSRFSGYDPSDIGHLRCAVWGDDFKMRRTVAQRGSVGLAGRLAPRPGQRILAGYGVQCRHLISSSRCTARR